MKKIQSLSIIRGLKMPKHLKILKKFKGKSAGIFVDEANLFYSQKTLGWRIDWGKVLKFLKKYCRIKIARYYMGMPYKTKMYEKNILVKNRLEKAGFEAVTKPLKKIYLDNKKKDYKYKCNFDVEITRDIIRNLEKISLVLLASSDSDFIGLKDDVIKHKKGFVFVCFEQSVAWEIRKSYHLFFEDIKGKIKY